MYRQTNSHPKLKILERLSRSLGSQKFLGHTLPATRRRIGFEKKYYGYGPSN